MRDLITRNPTKRAYFRVTTVPRRFQSDRGCKEEFCTLLSTPENGHSVGETWKPREKYLKYTGCGHMKARLNARNISTQHLATLLRATCYTRLATLKQDVGWCWIKFENGQIFVATFLDVARCCARLASSFTTSHSTIQQRCKMLR